MPRVVKGCQLETVLFISSTSFMGSLLFYFCCKKKKFFFPILLVEKKHRSNGTILFDKNVSHMSNFYSGIHASSDWLWVWALFAAFQFWCVWHMTRLSQSFLKCHPGWCQHALTAMVIEARNSCSFAGIAMAIFSTLGMLLCWLQKAEIMPQFVTATYLSRWCDFSWL